MTAVVSEKVSRDDRWFCNLVKVGLSFVITGSVLHCIHSSYNIFEPYVSSLVFVFVSCSCCCFFLTRSRLVHNGKN